MMGESINSTNTNKNGKLHNTPAAGGAAEFPHDVLALEQSLQAHAFDIGPDQALHYWTLGARNNSQGQAKPVLVLLHGMRDVGRSLLPIAAAVAENYFCVLPDLRGHGKSFKPGSYAIQHFLMDLRRLQQKLALKQMTLLGHSLGGHIACRYAGVFPDVVNELIIVDGLGPPRAELPASNELPGIAMQLDNAIITADRALNPRTLHNIIDAANRLLKNNPRLNPDWANELARWGTEPASTNPDELQWAFDARAQEVFLGISDTRNIDYWRAMQARSLVVMGDLHHEYWRERFQAPNSSNSYSGKYSDAEIQEKLAAIAQGSAASAELSIIKNAGHQVHYDQPHELATAVQTFLTAPGDYPHDRR